MSIKSLTIEILETIAHISKEIVAISIDRKAAYRALYNRFGEDWTPTRCSTYLKNLEKRGYLEINKSTIGDSIRFTNKAKLKVIDKIAEKIASDDNYYLVSFDIPELKRNNRNLFRRAIKALGFKQIQKSLWVTNKKSGDLVEIAAYEYGVEQYVVYIVSSLTNIDGLINKMISEN